MASRRTPQRPEARSAGRSPRGSDAFTLVALLIFVAVLNVMVAAALPLWSQTIQREKEEELIFRGLQYAEAIRLFQTRVGRYPLQLEELLEFEPRSIRQLYKDPMTESGEWGLIFAQGLQGGVGGQAGSQQLQRGGNLTGQPTTTGTGQPGLAPSQGLGRRNRRGGEIVTTGPITGVHSLSDDSAIKVFLGADKYSAWLFTPAVIPIAPTAPGDLVPSLNSKWVGRPFPEGFEPTGGTGIDDAFGNGEKPDAEKRRERKSERRKRRQGG